MADEEVKTLSARGNAAPIVACVIAAIGVSLFTIMLWSAVVTTHVYIVLLILLALVCIYINGPNGWAKNGAVGFGPADTPRTIALWLVMYFGLALAVVGIIAAFFPRALEKDWLDLFKSGFLLLGGGVTTIVGYYFGSRQTTQAIKAAGEKDSLQNEPSDGSIEPRPLKTLSKRVKRP